MKYSPRLTNSLYTLDTLHAKTKMHIIAYPILLFIGVRVSVGLTLRLLVFICSRFVVAFFIERLNRLLALLLRLVRLVRISSRLALESGHLTGNGV